MTAAVAGDAPVWRLTGLTKTYAFGWFDRRPPHVAVDRADFSVSPGERVAIIGESGSGKTTLVTCGLGLRAKNSGKIELLGQDASDWSRRQWRRARTRVQMLVQDPDALLNPDLRLSVQLAESARLHRADSHTGTEVARILDEVGLNGRANAWPHELSGGERRRASLARVLLAKPSLLVVDEPTTGLDAALKASLVELMLDRVGRACAVVIITHDLPMVAWAAERIAVMQAGRIVETFPIHDLTSADRHPYTQSLLRAGSKIAPADTL